MATKRLREKAAFTGGRVDRGPDLLVIRGALLCGRKSSNGYEYSTQAWAAGRVARYEGKPVHIEHAGRGGARLTDRVGVIRNARLRSDGLPLGDVHLNPRHPYAEALAWSAEHAPNSLGMSHVADCDIRNGIVTAIDAVVSCDLVSDPASVRGVFQESRRSGGRTMRIREYVRRVIARHGSRGGRLREMTDAVAFDAPMMDDAPAPDTGSADEAISAAIRSACAAVVNSVLAGELDQAAGLAKVRKLLKLRDELVTTDDADGEDLDGYGDAPLGESRCPADGKAFAEYIRGDSPAPPRVSRSHRIAERATASLPDRCPGTAAEFARMIRG